MSMILRSARGASAFTNTAPSLLDGVRESAPVFSKIEDPPEHAWDELIDELLGFRNLNDDWDGEGTTAPSRDLVDSAIILAQRMKAMGYSSADSVVVSVNSTVYFEWQTPLGYQEIEVTSPNDAELRWVQNGSNKTVVIRLSPRA